MINYFKADTISLLGGMRVKENSKHFIIMLFNKNIIKQNFTRVIKYFSVETALLCYCEAKHCDILRGSNLDHC